VLQDEPLASYDGGLNGYPTLPRTEAGAHQGRIDVNSSAARAYLELLAQRQNAFLAAASTQVGRTLTAEVALRHAVNALILDLSDAEAAQLRARGDVMLVERERQLELLTDRGPAFIGAPSKLDAADGAFMVARATHATHVTISPARIDVVASLEAPVALALVSDPHTGR